MPRSSVWWSRVTASALVVLLACPPSFSQSTLADWASAQNISPESTVWIKIKAGAKYHGELVRVTPDVLAIDSDEPAFPGRATRRREFNREDVREVWLVRPGASMAMGAAIGGGAGAGIGVALDATAKSHEYRGVMALLAGVLGAGLGAAIAHHHPLVKKKIYVAR